VLTLEEATRAIDELSARVRRLEQRLDAVEPETMRGVYDPLAQREPSTSPVLDAVGDALGAFGFLER
jgi:hypothetical protein